MNLSRCFRILSLSSICLLGFGLTGCIATSTSDTKISGKAIPDDVFVQIQPGKAKDFVTSLLGEPSKKITGDNGSEVWKWDYSETKMSEHSFIILFAGVNKTTTSQITVVEFDKDGKVTKASRE
jgi:outer membrane protein assembly factor BamE (lipoprotein component of BamABCDE complex)